jgi:hypothetical protein
MLQGNRKIPQEGSDENRQKEKELPYDAASQVIGSARFYDSLGDFSVSLYNGSDWVVTRVVLNITAKENDGTIRWSRDYSTAARTAIRPLTTGYVSVRLLGYEGTKETPWMIKNVFGYKETSSGY